MKVIIYGRDACPACDKAKLLCRMRSLEFEYLGVGTDISVEALRERVGQPVATLPQIFLDRGAGAAWIGGYDALRQAVA